MDYRKRFVTITLLFFGFVNISRSSLGSQVYIFVGFVSSVLRYRRNDDGLSAYTRLLPVSFEQEFGSFEKELRRSSEEIQAEVSLASKQAQKQESELQAEDRSEARKHRKMLVKLRESFHQSDVEGKVVRSEMDRRKSKKRKMQALDSLSTYDYQSTYKQIRKECVPGTSTWLLQDAQFKAWKEGNQKGLWCSGKCKYRRILRAPPALILLETVGSGKSVIWFA